MQYDNLYSEFIKRFPDDKEVLHIISQEASVDVSDGMHIMFGMVVVPFIVNLLSEENEEKLIIAFAFFEQMAKSKDSYICEVLEFTVLEDIISRGDNILNRCKKYMGKVTLECCKAVEKYMV